MLELGALLDVTCYLPCISLAGAGMAQGNASGEANKLYKPSEGMRSEVNCFVDAAEILNV